VRVNFFLVIPLKHVKSARFPLFRSVGGQHRFLTGNTEVPSPDWYRLIDNPARPCRSTGGKVVDPHSPPLFPRRAELLRSDTLEPIPPLPETARDGLEDQRIGRENPDEEGAGPKG